MEIKCFACVGIRFFEDKYLCRNKVYWYFIKINYILVLLDIGRCYRLLRRR